MEEGLATEALEVVELAALLHDVRDWRGLTYRSHHSCDRGQSVCGCRLHWYTMSKQLSSQRLS
jgi:hypothetical protein